MLGDKLDRIWKCCAEIIAKAAEDKIYKVYVASLKALSTLLNYTTFTTDLAYIRSGLRPILASVLLKCADGQRRMAELSLETISDLCFGQTFLIGTCGQTQRYLFSCIDYICNAWYISFYIAILKVVLGLM